MDPVRVAAVQATPVWMDREGSIAKVERLTAEAADGGAGLIVFPEVFVPGDPIWKDLFVPHEEPDAWFLALRDNAVVVPSTDTERIGRAAAAASAYLVVNVEEREATGSTIYNTTLYFGPDGRLLGTHRKLMPTASERLVWGMGDGADIQAFETPFGRLGGLTCWENYMPLPRFFLYSQGVDVWVAPTLAVGDAWVSTLIHIAREGRVWVIGANPVGRFDDLPATFPEIERMGTFPDEDGEWAWVGNSAIVGPDGKLVAGPLRHEEGILYADADIGLARSLRRLFDPTGHYNRPDVFRLRVTQQPRPAVEVVHPAEEQD